MVWVIVSFLIAAALSFLGVMVSDYPFDIFAKVVYWLTVLIFLNAQMFHFIHLVRQRDGG